jgi:hypothetical protein
MKKSISTISALLMVAGSLLAQNETDVLRYSQLTFGGTARYSGMAGAFGALGADFSTLSSNPAGIGVYRRSELTLSPSIFNQSTSSSYMGTVTDDQKMNFNFGNVGIVLTGNLQRESNHSGWKFFQFGFGLNRLANYQSNTTIMGTNPNSLLDSYVNSANGNTPGNLDPFSTGLAFNAWMLDTLSSSGGTQYRNALQPGEKVIQNYSRSTSGAYNETVITLGGNYEDKLFLGGTIGIPTIRYNENSTYSETAANPGYNGSNFSSFVLNQNLTTTGRGFNFKMGAIYKPIEWLRLGVAVHTPTWLTMNDSWNSSMGSTFLNGVNNTSAVNNVSPDGNFNYSITTPMRLIGSVGFVIGSYGMIGIDVEHVDYSSASLSASPNVFATQNEAIRSDLTATNNFRVGGEIKLKPLLLRLGYAYYGDPYSSNVSTDGSHQSFSGGFGFRNSHYFADFAYVFTQFKENYYLFDPAVVGSPSVNSTTLSSYMVTLGVKF